MRVTEVEKRLEFTLRSAVAENDSHSQRIVRARDLLAPSFPLATEDLLKLPEDKLSVLDQFLYRFTKMQDSLGTRFFPALYSLLEGTDRPVPFLDVLNRLEQLQVLTSVDTWQFFRNLRNKLAHDYPETVAQTVETLNLLHGQVSTFLELYQTARAVCVQRVPLEAI